MILQKKSGAAEAAGSPDGCSDEDNVFFERLLAQTMTVSEASFGLEQGMGRIQDHGKAQDGLVMAAAAGSRKNLDLMNGLARDSHALSQRARTAKEAGERGQTHVEGFFTGLESLFGQVEYSARFMERLTGEAGRMLGLMRTIEDIAELLKVLGINASIEAARAGQAGRGFAVVAKEVQNLAGRAQASAAEADGIIRDLERQIRDVDSSLSQAGVSVQENHSLGGSLREELSLITRLNLELEDKTVSLGEAIDSQSSFARDIDQTTTGLLEINKRVQADVDTSVTMSHRLKDVVDQVLSLMGTRQLRFHEACAASLRSLAAKVENFPPDSDLKTALVRLFGTWNSFSLLYVMDPAGRQIHDNAVNPSCGEGMDTSGKGEDRSAKPYFRGLKDSGLSSGEEKNGGRAGRVFISDVYVSSASRQLCLTASIELKDGRVLAGDLGLREFLDSQARPAAGA